MGKKTMGKKGRKKEKSKNKEQNTLEDVSGGENELPMSVEDGVKSWVKDGEKNDNVHENIGNGVEFSATKCEDGTEADLSAKKKKKKKNRHELNGVNVELSAAKLSVTKNTVVMEKDADGDMEKKKKKKNREISGNHVDYSGSQSRVVAEGNANKDKRNKENEKLLEVSGHGVGFNANESKGVTVDKNRKRNGAKDDDLEVDPGQNGAGKEGDASSKVNGMEKKKKNEKKKIHEMNDDDVELSGAELSVAENKVATKNDLDGDGDKKKNKKKKKKYQIYGNDVCLSGSQSEAQVEDNVRKDKRKKKENKKLQEVTVEDVEFRANESDGVINGSMPADKKIKGHEVSGDDGDVSSKKNTMDNEKKEKKKKRKMEGSEDMTSINAKKKHKREFVEDGGHKDKIKKTKSLIDDKEGGDKLVARNKKGADGKKGERSRKVSFSDRVEVFPSSNGSSSAENTEDNGLVRGKRFSKEEDEIIKKAVSSYIESRRLGEDGLNMILHCKSHKDLKNCWKEIGAAIPWRPHESVYYRAHILFERDENRKWTPEELEFVRKFHEKHGSDWKTLAEALGKHRFHVKDAWRRIKLANANKGQWSQEEYQNLFDLVNMDLRMKAFEEKKTKHGMLRDNISWEAISEKLATRSNALCCQKWYYQLASPLVAEGKWSDTDDYNLVNALFSLDACCIEDVDWDNLLEHRDGSVCRKRWNQMVKHLGPYGAKSFAEQVEVLSKRYCPDVLEAREAYNSSPVA